MDRLWLFDNEGYYEDLTPPKRLSLNLLPVRFDCDSLCIRLSVDFRSQLLLRKYRRATAVSVFGTSEANTLNLSKHGNPLVSVTPSVVELHLLINAPCFSIGVMLFLRSIHSSISQIAFLHGKISRDSD